MAETSPPASPMQHPRRHPCNTPGVTHASPPASPGITRASPSSHQQLTRPSPRSRDSGRRRSPARSGKEMALAIAPNPAPPQSSRYNSLPHPARNLSRASASRTGPEPRHSYLLIPVKLVVGNRVFANVVGNTPQSGASAKSGILGPFRGISPPTSAAGELRQYSKNGMERYTAGQR
jgi:hypothetical protein